MSDRIRLPSAPLTPPRGRAGLVDEIRSTLGSISTEELRRQRDHQLAEAVRAALDRGAPVELSIGGRRVTIRCEPAEDEG